ncbi:MAG: glycosyltransferase [Bacteroidetes bacterium]|nr:glycosyltransferase [Bacteroidota bacterium]MBS1649274.1 glycosyltransferase [Bacteroidota bacterium]
MVRLSIITINFNNKVGLEATIQSVINQTYSNFEYIVIDGGSSDGSKELIENYSSKITYWVSENDNGIYHAMNKGAAKATGNYLLFLNAADVLANNKVIEEVADAIAKTNELYSFYTGNMQLIENKFIAKSPIPSEISFNYFYKSSLCHPSTFISNKLFKIIGGYNEKNKIVSDWEFFITAFTYYSATYYRLPILITLFDTNGISANRFDETMNNERKQILETKFSFFYQDYKKMNEMENDYKQYHYSRLHQLLARLISVFRKK